MGWPKMDLCFGFGGGRVVGGKRVAGRSGIGSWLWPWLGRRAGFWVALVVDRGGALAGSEPVTFGTG